MKTELKKLSGGGGLTTEQTTIINEITEETIEEITNINNFLTEQTIQEITNVNNYYTEVQQTAGFTDPTASQITFDNETRTLSLTPTSEEDGYVVYIFGTRTLITTVKTKQIDKY